MFFDLPQKQVQIFSSSQKGNSLVKIFLTSFVLMFGIMSLQFLGLKYSTPTSHYYQENISGAIRLQRMLPNQNQLW